MCRKQARTRRSSSRGSVAARRARARAPLRRREVLADAAQVGPRLGRPRGREPVPQLAHAVGGGDEGALREHGEEAGAGDEQATAERGTPVARVGHQRGSPASIRAASASWRRASAGSDGQMGLKLYHWAGAAPIVAWRLSAMRWVARWRSAGDEDGTVNGSTPRSGTARTAAGGSRRGAMIAPVFAASVAGPGRERRPRVEQADRDAVVAVAPVHEQGQDLAALQDPEQLAQVAPRDDPDAPALALAAQELEQLREGRVVGDDVGRVAGAGDGGGHGLVVAHVPGDDDHGLPGLPPLAASRSMPSPSMPRASSSRGRDGRRISSTM